MIKSLFYKFIFILLIIIFPTINYAQLFSLSERDKFYKEINESYLYLYQGVRVYMNTTKISYKDVRLISNDVIIKEINNREYSLFNKRKDLDSVKIILIKKKTKRALDSLFLITTYFHINLRSGVLSDSDGVPLDLDSKSFSSFSIRSKNKFVNDILIQGFEIEILDTNMNVFYNKKIQGPHISERSIDEIKKKYTNPYFLLRLKNIYFKDGNHLLLLPDYLLRPPRSLPPPQINRDYLFYSRPYIWLTKIKLPFRCCWSSFLPRQIIKVNECLCWCFRRYP